MIHVALAGLATALLLGVAGGAPVARAAELRLKGVSNSRPQVQFKMWEWMEAELSKRTNGQVKLEVTSLPELGLTGFELVRVMRRSLNSEVIACLEAFVQPAPVDAEALLAEARAVRITPKRPVTDRMLNRFKRAGRL